MTQSIDINCDMGERRGEDGSEEELMRYIASANIACGGYAGDAFTMDRTVQLARKHRIAIGAHPGFPDRENFGRKVITLSTDELRGFVYDQVHALAEIV